MDRLRWLLRRREPAAPALSVVVPVYNVGAYLAECLESLLGQTFADLEVIAVDDGSTDDCPGILARFAASDPRLVCIRQDNAGQGAARNRGVQLARGEYVTFVDSDDTIPPRALGEMIRTIRLTGSDFCVGKTRRLHHGRFSGLGWNGIVHDRDRFGITLEDYPLALRDIIAGNRVFRRSFLLEHVPRFETGIAYEDHVPMLMAYVRAGQFDLLSKVTYNWRNREDLSSTGQQKATIRNLRDRLTVKAQALELLRAEASQAVLDAWVGRCLGTDFPPFLRASFGATDEYRELMANAYRTFLDLATPAGLSSVGPPNKVAAWLAAQGRWEDAERTLEHYADPSTPFPSRVERNGLVLARPQGIDLDDVPEHCFRIAEQDVRLICALRGFRSLDGEISLTVVVHVHRVDGGNPPTQVSARLVETETGATRPMAVVTGFDAEAQIWASDGHTDARPCVATLSIATSSLGPGRWAVEISATHQGLTRSGAIWDMVSGALPPADPHWVDVHPLRDPARGLVLVVDQPHDQR